MLDPYDEPNGVLAEAQCRLVIGDPSYTFWSYFVIRLESLLITEGVVFVASGGMNDEIDVLFSLLSKVVQFIYCYDEIMNRLQSRTCLTKGMLYYAMYACRRNKTCGAYRRGLFPAMNECGLMRMMLTMTTQPTTSRRPL